MKCITAGVSNWRVVGSCRSKSLVGLDVGLPGMGRIGALPGRGQLRRGLRKTWAGKWEPDVLSLMAGKKGVGNVVSEEMATEGAEMVWGKNWYPILPLRDVDPKNPYPFTLLGRKMVLWRNGEGEWCCLDDRCAHRQIPLSRGRASLRDGSLMCSYHGWCFDKKGNCVHIPQALPEQQGNLCNSDRSKVQSYPVQVMIRDAVFGHAVVYP